MRNRVGFLFHFNHIKRAEEIGDFKEKGEEKT